MAWPDAKQRAWQLCGGATPASWGEGCGGCPRQDGFVGHQPEGLTLMADLPPRQVAESRQHQAVLLPAEGEAGQPQAITAAADQRHGMHMPADIEPARTRLWRMAQP